MVEDYTAIPVGVLDTVGGAATAIVITGCVFDNRLDPDKIENAVEQLTVHWPLLTSRLRINNSTGAWEYRIPAKFSAVTPKYVFKRVTKAGSIHEHYRYAKPPTCTEISCTLRPNYDHLFSLEGPRHVKRDFLAKDIPVVHFQLTSFDDASILGLTTPHAFCDGDGSEKVARALALILQGGKPEPLSEADPFKPYSKGENTIPFTTPRTWSFFSPVQVIALALRIFWDYAWTPRTENRDVYIPPDQVVKIKDEAVRDLREGCSDPDAWISTSDALVAFCLKCMYPPSAHQKSKRPFNLAYIVNLRQYFPQLFPRNFLHNAIVPVITPTVTLADISSMTLGSLAYMVRTSIQEQTKAPCMENWLRWRLSAPKMLALFFEPRGTWAVFTNMRSIKIMDVDFSEGLLADASDVKGKVKCVHIHAKSHQPIPPRGCMVLVANDARGGVWIEGHLKKGDWKRKDGFGRFIL